MELVGANKQSSKNGQPSMLQQLLPLLAVQQMGANGGDKRGAGLVQLLALDAATKAVPVGLSAIAGVCRAFFRRRAQHVMEALNGASMARKKGSVILDRVFDKSVPSDADETFDAVLALASDLPLARFVRRTVLGNFILDTAEDVYIGDGAYVRRISVAEDANSNICRMSLEVFSFDKDIVQLRDMLSKTEENYRLQRQNKLGRDLYYFDEQVQRPFVSSDGVPDLSRSLPRLLFGMFKMHTNKSMTNVYGRAADQVRNMVRFFLDNKPWYELRGIPYTLGILLHGPPGCGKTSIIKAIARDSNRHIVNIKLSAYTTTTQLSNLLYSGTLSVVRDGKTETLQMPIDRTILVMEDIDCLSNVVLSRRRRAKQQKEETCADAREVGEVLQRLTKAGVPQNAAERDQMAGEINRLSQMHERKKTADSANSKDADRLTLSAMLNMMDGVLETPGRIIIMTSNHPEHLDPALIRPGRIDVSVEFGKCSEADMIEIVSKMCEVPPPRPPKPLAEGVWTPAEVMKEVFKNMNNLNVLMDVLAGSPPSNLAESDEDDEEEIERGDKETGGEQGFARAKQEPAALQAVSHSGDQATPGQSPLVRPLSNRQKDGPVWGGTEAHNGPIEPFELGVQPWSWPPS